MSSLADGSRHGAADRCLRQWVYAELARGGAGWKGGSTMNATTGNHVPAQMKASDSDRDAVVSNLSEHFQAGRLTAGEFDERTGSALAARTWGELRDLLADLPAAQPGPVAPATRAFRLPPVAVLAGLVIAVIVLVNMATIGW